MLLNHAYGIFFLKKWSSRAASGIFENWLSRAYFGHFKKSLAF